MTKSELRAYAKKHNISLTEARTQVNAEQYPEGKRKPEGKPVIITDLSSVYLNEGVTHVRGLIKQILAMDPDTASIGCPTFLTNLFPNTWTVRDVGQKYLDQGHDLEVSIVTIGCDK